MSAMDRFQNGHSYRIAVAFSPPPGKRLPFVEIEMAGVPGQFVSVVGKMDTGADVTMLDFATADSLGIADPKSGRQRMASVANKQPIIYYVHTVFVRVKIGFQQSLDFPLEVGFYQSLARNLFGIDWTEHMIVVVDREQVHLLRD